MCILFLHTNPDPKENEYRLIVATNRDEYLKRPAKTAYKCPKTGIISGRDMEPGREYGGWLGFIAKNYPENGTPSKYCFGCLTNLSGGEKLQNANGRGSLVINYLEGQANFPEYIKALRKDKLVFGGFNLIGVELSKDGTTKTYHTSNQPQIDSEYTGKHTLAFGNSTIDSPYMKVLNGRASFLGVIEKGLNKEELKEELVALLKDNTKHLPDFELSRRIKNPKVSEELSRIFIEPSRLYEYGTRTHTIVLVDKNFNAEFTEITLEEPISVENPKWITTVIKARL